MMLLIVFGYGLFVYGMYKLVTCWLDIVLSYEQKKVLIQDFPALKDAITFDATTSGKTLSIVYIIFAAFTVLMSANRISRGFLDRAVFEILNDRLFIYLLYGLFGSFLLTMYCLVIYTNIEIQKDMKYFKRYKLMGICGGRVFIASAPIFYMLHKSLDHGFNNALKKYLFATILTVLVTLIAAGAIMYFGYTVLIDGDINEKSNVKWHDILTLVIIPAIVP